MERSNQASKHSELTHPEYMQAEGMLADMLFHHLTDMIFIMEAENGTRFRYFFINKKGMEIAGLDDGCLGRYIEDVLPADRAAMLNEYYKRSLQREEPVIYMDEVRSAPGGKLLAFESKLTSVKHNNGKAYVVCVSRELNRESTEAIRYLELHDNLTGLLNRRAFMEDAEEEIVRAEKQNTELAVIHLDIDRFKQVNDMLGHKNGDGLLRSVANRLIKHSVPECKYYRQGGDEFVMILFGKDRRETEKYVQKLLSIFNAPFAMENQELYLTPSIGISMYPHDGRDVQTLLKGTDHAIFLVKKQGGANYHFYHSDMQASFSNDFVMEAHLRRAIEKDELTIHYQPQIHLQSGQVKSFEALLRWNNRKFGSVSPAQFIPVAEETGLIVPIGEWVIKKVCAQIADWRKKGYGDIRIAVNISPRQFVQPTLPVFIKSTLNEIGIPAHSLEIEITEGAMQDTRITLDMLHRLKDLGVILSVDDFGTGYSSLNYLKKFPIDILKIDQSFVREIEKNEKNAAITKTIIHLAHSLGLEVVAEGVEEEVQAEFLIDANCQKAQGYYFSHPVSAEEIEDKLFRK